MAKAVTKEERLTFEDYLKMPEVKGRYEIVDGVMRMTPAPNIEHQWIVGRLFKILDRFVEERRLGVVLMAPVDVVISRQPLRTRQPDVLFLSRERGGKPEAAEFRSLPFLEVGPDLVVEVLSPSETRADIEEKIADYCQLGVRECWVVSPEARTVEILRLSKERPERVGIFGRGERAKSEALPEFEIEVDEIFGRA